MYLYRVYMYLYRVYMYLYRNYMYFIDLIKPEKRVGKKAIKQ